MTLKIEQMVLSKRYSRVQRSLDRLQKVAALDQLTYSPSADHANASRHLFVVRRLKKVLS